ncbi:MAG TPA: hypothetical protein DEF77_07325 [Gammaproteobacteria bacterium]|nr:hypothetical protein [Gammaproteobacteria bacterium]
MSHGCADNGAKVDLKTCLLGLEKGAGELATKWQDPTYNSRVSLLWPAQSDAETTSRE